MLTPPSIAPMSGGTASCPSRSTATLRGLGRLAHSGPLGMLRGAGLECTPTAKRRVWDSNPRDIAAHWFSRPGPSAARTTLPTDAAGKRTLVEQASSLSDGTIAHCSRDAWGGP